MLSEFLFGNFLSISPLIKRVLCSQSMVHTVVKFIAEPCGLSLFARATDAFTLRLPSLFRLRCGLTSVDFHPPRA